MEGSAAMARVKSKGTCGVLQLKLGLNHLSCGWESTCTPLSTHGRRYITPQGRYATGIVCPHLTYWVSAPITALAQQRGSLERGKNRTVTPAETQWAASSERSQFYSASAMRGCGLSNYLCCRNMVEWPLTSRDGLDGTKTYREAVGSLLALNFLRNLNFTDVAIGSLGQSWTPSKCFALKLCGTDGGESDANQGEEQKESEWMEREPICLRKREVSAEVFQPQKFWDAWFIVWLKAYFVEMPGWGEKLACNIQGRSHGSLSHRDLKLDGLWLCSCRDLIFVKLPSIHGQHGQSIFFSIQYPQTCKWSPFYINYY